MRTRETKNEHGVPIAHYICQTCSRDYTVTPAPYDDDGWDNCMDKACASYDPTRDVDWMFPSDPKVTPIRQSKRT